MQIDPLEFFPPEISEVIFENLSGSDLLQASLVSPSWHYFIAKTKILMKKIKLKFYCNCDLQVLDNVLSALKESERNYENLEVESCSMCMKKILPLLSLHEWKFVKIQRSNFLNSEQASDFFNRIQNSLEVLDISEVYVKNAYTAGKNEELKYPKLKVFNTKNMQSFLYFDIFANIKTLEEFSAASNNQNVASLNTILELLKVNKNLKKLGISGRLLYQIFYDDVTKFVQFKLNEISIANQNYVGEANQDRVFENFQKFLKHQVTLTSIIMDKWMGQDVLMTILQLPIKKLKIINNIPRDCVNVGQICPYEHNSSIIDLSIQSSWTDVATRIIEFLPNLRNLSCTYADEKFIWFLEKMARKLKSLSIDFLNVEDFSDYDIFKNVKNLKISNYFSEMKGIDL